MPADTLSSDSLDWALTHISRFGDTDIFPVPFEFDAIKHGWNWIKAELEKIDLTDYRTRGIETYARPEGGRRVSRGDPVRPD